MLAYKMKNVESTECASEKYICVNNLGFRENLTNVQTRRERGRLDYQMIYVKSGELTIHEDGRDCRVGAGGICLFRPHEAQIYSFGDLPTAFFWIHFSGSEAERLLSFFKERAYYVGEFPEFEEYCHGFSHDFHAEQCYTDMLYEGKLIALFARVAERIFRDEKTHKDFLRIREALSLMRTEWWHRRTNSELAAVSGVSRDSFEKTFKRITGSTPHQYYATLIAEKGAELLSTTTYTIAEISRLCGVEDSLYFSRLFKKKVGLSPAAYRKAATAVC